MLRLWMNACIWQAICGLMIQGALDIHGCEVKRKVIMMEKHTQSYNLKQESKLETSD